MSNLCTFIKYFENFEQIFTDVGKILDKGKFERKENHMLVNVAKLNVYNINFLFCLL